MPHELRVLLELWTQALLGDLHHVYSQLQILIDQVLRQMKPLLGALRFVEDARLCQWNHIRGELVHGSLREKLVDKLLHHKDELVLQRLLGLDVTPLLRLRQLHLHPDDQLHLLEDLGHDLMPRSDELLLEVHPQPVEELDVLLELCFEAWKARGKVVLEPGLDLAGDLRHGAVHLLQEGLRGQLDLIRVGMQHSIECHARLLLRFPSLSDDVYIEASGEELRCRRKKPVKVVEAIVLVGVHAKVLGQEPHHVQKAGHLLVGELVQGIRRYEW
mmetsp:Transcript_780/g.1749  ORF Transcript_780/g.1749 Transcript_780/m.1749 type:complete len:273 (+) Transcript_780:281-1099(+)